MLLQGGEVENEDIIADNHGAESTGVRHGHPQIYHDIGCNGKSEYVSNSLEVAALGQNAKMIPDDPGNFFFT